MIPGCGRSRPQRLESRCNYWETYHLASASHPGAASQRVFPTGPLSTAAMSCLCSPGDGKQRVNGLHLPPKWSCKYPAFLYRAGLPGCGVAVGVLLSWGGGCCCSRLWKTKCLFCAQGTQQLHSSVFTGDTARVQGTPANGFSCQSVDLKVTWATKKPDRYFEMGFCKESWQWIWAVQWFWEWLKDWQNQDTLML